MVLWLSTRPLSICCCSLKTCSFSSSTSSSVASRITRSPLAILRQCCISLSAAAFRFGQRRRRMRSVPDGIDNCGVERFCKSCPSRTQMLFLGNSLHTGTVKMFHATSFSCVKWRVFDTTNTPLALDVPYILKTPFDSVPHAFHARPCGSSVFGIIPATAKLTEKQCPACFWA
jgi:hypothetical protein